MSVSVWRFLSVGVVCGLVLSFTSIPLALASQADTRFEGAVEATYQSGFDRDDVSKGLPARRGDAAAKVDLANDGFSYAEAKGFASGMDFIALDGSDVHSYSRAGGFDPSFGPPQQNLWAAADFESNIFWWSQSNRLPMGEPIIVEVTLDLKGTIVASGSSNSGPTATTASAQVGLAKTAGPGGPLDYFGIVDAVVSPNDGFADPPVLTTGGDWNHGDFSQTPLNSPLGVLQKFDLEVTETLTFASRIGDPFTLLLNVPTDVDAIGPFENLAVADITASYRLRALDPVTKKPLPPALFLGSNDPLDPDVDGDGDVDGYDFLELQQRVPSLLDEWQLSYGRQSGASFSPIIAGVPEPATWMLALVGAVAHGCLGRRRWQLVTATAPSFCRNSSDFEL